MYIIEFKQYSPKTKKRLTEAHKKRISESLKRQKAKNKPKIDKALSRAATVAGILQTASFTYDRFRRTQNRLNTDRARTALQGFRTASDSTRTLLQGVNAAKRYF